MRDDGRERDRHPSPRDEHDRSLPERHCLLAPRGDGRPSEGPDERGRDPSKPIADPTRELLLPQREREQSDGDREDGETDQRRKDERRIGLTGDGEERERDDRQAELEEDVPNARDADVQGDVLASEAPRPEHAVRQPDGYGAARRQG